MTQILPETQLEQSVCVAVIIEGHFGGGRIIK